MSQPVSTPCVRLCLLDPASGLCRGCGRTRAEIGRWPAMGEDERLALMAALPARLLPESDGSLMVPRLDARKSKL